MEKRMFKPIRSLVLPAALAIAPLVAFADQGHSHAQRGPNGGQMRDIGAMHVEVIAKPGELVVYLFDAKDAKIPTAGATGKATILVKGRKTEVVLAPDGENRLSGKGDFAADKSLVAVVSVTPAAQKALQGRFEPLK
jgi:hypothetical protein